MRSKIFRFAVAAVLALVAARGLAWNALGHRVVAEIAWQKITPEQRRSIVDILKRHPRFAEDFVAQMPADVAKGDEAQLDRWIFWQAAVWPDVARGGPFDRPTWHYVNRPIFLDGKQVPVGAQLSTAYPGKTPVDRLNCIQAVKYGRAVLQDRQAGADAKALAYCWLFHLVGDMHQPLHSTALFCERFPDGDRGGNDIPLRQGRNLHALWDGLLGRDDRRQNVLREAQRLVADRDTMEIATDAKPEVWIDEGHELAQDFAYNDAILEVVLRATPQQPLERIELSEAYLKAAGGHARKRVLAAGLRLGAILNSR